MDNKNIKQKVISGLIWKFAERISAQLVTFIVSIVLARLLSPSDYGAIAIVNIFIALDPCSGALSGAGGLLLPRRGGRHPVHLLPEQRRPAVHHPAV